MLVNQLKFEKPVFALCHICSTRYDMARYGVICPSCRGRKKIKKR